MTPSLENVVREAGFELTELGPGVVVHARSDDKDVAVQVQQLKGIAVFGIALSAAPRRFGAARALRTLLRITASAGYVKAVSLEGNVLGLTAELPTGVLTPPAVTALVRSLAVFGNLQTADLLSDRGMAGRAEKCMLIQASALSLDVGRTAETIPSVLGELGLSATPGLGRSVVTVLDPSVPEVSVTPGPGSVSLVTALRGVGPSGDKKDYLQRLLALNKIVDVGRVGLQSNDDVVLVYSVPRLTREVLDHARTQFGMLYMGVMAVDRKR